MCYVKMALIKVGLQPQATTAVEDSTIKNSNIKILGTLIGLLN